MIKIAPSILSADFGQLNSDIALVEKAGVDYLHIDVMDGHFVPNITIGPLILESIRSKSNLYFDVHLMIENPDNYIPQFINAGADSITVHVEACRHLHSTVQLIKSYGKKVGVALNPATPVSFIKPILEDIDMVLIMTVNPGFGGQTFISGMLKKILELRKIIEDRKLDIDIEVDGGIKLENLNEVVNAGANVIVAGSAIFLSENIEEAVKNFKKIGGKV